MIGIKGIIIMSYGRVSNTIVETRNYCSIFSDDWEMRIGKRKVLLKLTPIRYDVGKKALNFKGDEKSRLSLYVV